MVQFASHETLDDLVDLWHEGTWPDLELEEVIREATGWSHLTYDRWAATGYTPTDKAPEWADQNWCGHIWPPR
jgi:hypothetical protein